MPGREPPLEELINAIARLPSVGTKTAVRIAYHLINADQRIADTLIGTIRVARNVLKHCRSCRRLSARDPCDICANPVRSPEVLCIVITDEDLHVIEASGGFSGRYFIIGGELAPRAGVDVSHLALEALTIRAQDPALTEIILATNPTIPGELTAAFLGKHLRASGIKIRITRLALGLPMNSQIEYADSTTLKKSMENRREING